MKSRMSVAWLILAVFAGMAALSPEAHAARGSRPGGTRPGAVMTEEARRAAIGQVFVALEAKKAAGVSRLQADLRAELQFARNQMAAIVEMMSPYADGRQERVRIYMTRSIAGQNISADWRIERQRWRAAVQSAAGELIRLRASGAVLRRLDSVGGAGLAEISGVHENAQRTLSEIAADAMELIELLVGDE